MTVTTKTKKDDLVNIAIQMKLIESIEEANKLTSKELYTLIKGKEVVEAKPNEAEVVSSQSDGITDEMVAKLNEHFNGGVDKKTGRRPLPKKEKGSNVINIEQKVDTESDVVAKPVEPIESSEKEVAEEQNTVESEVVVTQDVETSEDNKYKSEEVERNKIINSFVLLKGKCDELTNKNKILEKEKMQISSKLENMERKYNNFYNGIVDILNKLANTKEERYIWVCTLLSEYLKAHPNDNAPLVLDIRKLILADDIRNREEKELLDEFAVEKNNKGAKQIKTKVSEDEIDEDTEYVGDNISYIKGKIVKGKNINKKTFNDYKDWCLDAKEWVEYTLSELEDVDKTKSENKKATILKSLNTELKKWYKDWVGCGCDSDTIDMVKSVFSELMSDRDEDVALSNLVCIIDELDEDIITA